MLMLSITSEKVTKPFSRDDDGVPDVAGLADAPFRRDAAAVAGVVAFPAKSVGNVEAHPKAVRELPHPVDDGGLDGPVQPLVALLLAVLHVELMDVVPEHLAHRRVSGLEPVVGPALHAEEFGGNAVRARLLRRPDERWVVLAASDDERPEPERDVDADVGEPLDDCEPLLRRRDAALNLPGLLRVCGDDADFDVPVVRVPGEKLHVAAVLRPPRRLRREG